MIKYYAGIGSRKTPILILNQMREFARLAAYIGLYLRSGGAPGADTMFEIGADQDEYIDERKEIFLPWKNFEDNHSRFHGASNDAFKLAAAIHPYFNNMKMPNKKLVARNMHQILGQDLNTPVEFVVCWTPDGCEHQQDYNPTKTGGTGSAIALASRLDIPVYNLYNEGRLEKAYQYAIMLKLNEDNAKFQEKNTHD